MGWIRKSPAASRYFRFNGAILFFVAISIVLAYLSFHGVHPRGTLAWVLALMPAMAIIGALVSSGFYVAEETDEFQRNLYIQSILWGVGGILVLTSVWGWLQIYTQVCNYPAIWTFPFFLFCQFIALVALKWRHR